LKRKRIRLKCIVIPGDSDPCPRCGEPMQIREYVQGGAVSFRSAEVRRAEVSVPDVHAAEVRPAEVRE